MLARTLFVVCMLVGPCVSSAMSSGEVKIPRVQDANFRRQVAIPQSTISATHPSPPVIVAPISTPATSAPTPPSPIVEITIVITAPSEGRTRPTRVPTSSMPSSSNSSANPSQVTDSEAQPESQRKFNLLYLVPVFIFLGILWGALAAWLAYKWLTKRHKARNDILIGGPRYIPAPNDVEGGKPSQQNEIQMVTFSWPDLKQAGEESEKHADHEDDPFLFPPSPTKARKAERTKSARSTTTTAYSADVLETDDEGRKEDVPWESLRHKSIKRGILAEVQKEGNRINSLRPAGTLRNTGTEVEKTVERRVSRHGRSDSDHLINDITQMLSGADVQVPSNSRPPNPRTDSAITTLSLVSTTTAGDKTQWKPGKGFRIVEESPLSSRGPTPVPPGDSAPFGMSSAAGDRYTSTPVRHDTTSTYKGFTAPSTPARTHADVLLPQSPPQITSPLLENSLCFTPTGPPKAPMAPLTKPTSAKRVDTSKKLPLPGSGNGVINSPRPDMYRGRLAKSPKKPQRPPITSKSSSSDGRAVHAIKRVEDIVERSWGARDLGAEGVRTLSPTGFGRPTCN